MNIKKLNEELKKLMNENVGDVLYSHKMLNGNPYDVIDEGQVTFVFMNTPIRYQLKRFEERDKETEQLVRTGYEISLIDKDLIEQIKDKVILDFKKQLKDNYDVNVTNIGGSIMIGIPDSAEFKK